MKITQNDLLFTFALLCAIWFAWFGMVWIYWAALFIAYPAGLLSLIIWLIIRKENRNRTKFIPGLLVLGVVLSLLALFYFLIWD